MRVNHSTPFLIEKYENSYNFMQYKTYFDYHKFNEYFLKEIFLTTVNTPEKDIYRNDTFSELNNKFDIIFLDPPYKNKDLDKVLININIQKILKQNGIIIIHRHKNEQDLLPKNFQVVEQKKYGISKIIFLKNLDK